MGIGAFFRGSRVARTDSVVAAAAPAITCKAASPPIPSAPMKSTPNEMPLTGSAAPVVASTESTPEKLTNKGAVDDSAAGTATSMEFANDSPSGKKARDAQKGVSSTGSAVPAPAPTLALPGAVTMEKPSQKEPLMGAVLESAPEHSYAGAATAVVAPSEALHPSTAASGKISCPEPVAGSVSPKSSSPSDRATQVPDAQMDFFKRFAFRPSNSSSTCIEEPIAEHTAKRAPSGKKSVSKKRKL